MKCRSMIHRLLFLVVSFCSTVIVCCFKNLSPRYNYVKTDDDDEEGETIMRRRGVMKQFVIQYYVDSETDDEENDDSPPSPVLANAISDDAHKSEYCSYYINYTVGSQKVLQVNLPLPVSRNKSTGNNDGDDHKVKRLAVIIKETTPPENGSTAVPRRKRTEIAGRSTSGSVKVMEEKKAAKLNKSTAAKIKKIKCYRSSQRILLVGEGDFSFSTCLAEAFGSASNMIATSLDSQAFLEENYGSAPSNIEKLKSRGCKVMHEIDATKMASHALLGHLKFDRIIFNFPHAGFFGSMPHENKLRRHRRLISLFLKNAREMISEDGEIHISHKTNGTHVEWKVESIASSHGLGLIAAVKFQPLDYPGYNTKYGFGGDGNFNCYPCQTYKFGRKLNVDSKEPSLETANDG